MKFFYWKHKQNQNNRNILSRPSEEYFVKGQGKSLSCLPWGKSLPGVPIASSPQGKEWSIRQPPGKSQPGPTGGMLRVGVGAPRWCWEEKRQNLAGERGRKPNPAPSKGKWWHSHWGQQGKSQCQAMKQNFPHGAPHRGGDVCLGKWRILGDSPKWGQCSLLLFSDKLGDTGSSQAFTVHCHRAVSAQRCSALLWTHCLKFLSLGNASSWPYRPCLRWACWVWSPTVKVRISFEVHSTHQTFTSCQVTCSWLQGKQLRALGSRAAFAAPRHSVTCGASGETSLPSHPLLLLVALLQFSSQS